MRSRSFEGLVFSLGLLLLAAPAAALTILDDQRGIRAHGFTSCGTTSCSHAETKEVVHPGGSHFQAGAYANGAYAWQSSRTGVDGIAGTGITTSDIGADILETESHSRLAIEFELDTATPFALFGFVEAVGDPDFGQGQVTATVRLSDAGGDLHLFSVSVFDSTESQSFDESFVLGAGVYTLFAEARQDYPSSYRESRFRLTLAVPEPAAGPLLALGLAALAGTRRVRRAGGRGDRAWPLREMRSGGKAPPQPGAAVGR